MKHYTLFVIAFHFFSLTNAQTTLQGSVSDRIDPLPWANIYIKNTTKGTVTDDHGNFTLEVKKGDTLAISYMGYQTKEIIIDTQKEVAITLEGESLDEVVITAQRVQTCRVPLCGYRTIKSHMLRCTSAGIIIEITPDDSLSKNTNQSLFPNPSSDGIFNLKMANPHKEVQVYVTNLLGQQVQSSTYQNSTNTIRLNLSLLRTGVYLIHTIADGQPLPTQKAIRK